MSQTYGNIEIIVVNDGSPDSSEKIVKRLQKEDERIKIISQKNSGVSIARNTGLDIAKGEYVTFVDSDDYVTKDYVEYLFHLIDDHDADFAYSTHIFKSKSDRQVDADIIRVVDRDESTGILLSPDVTVGSWNKIYRRSVIDNNKLRFRSDLFYGEGLNFIIRMSLASRKIVVGEKKVLYYRKNNFSSATTKYSHEKYCNGLESLRIIGEMVNFRDHYVNSMFQLHLSFFYLGAIVKIIENKKIEEHPIDYKKWKGDLRSKLWFILTSKRISIYRKIILLIGAFLPRILAMMDERRTTKMIKESV